MLKRYHQILKEKAEAVGGEVYRVGGDEVAGRIPRLDLEGARRLGENIRSGVETEFKGMPMIAILPMKPTTSIGIVTFTKRILPAEALRYADKQLYKAKAAGRNTVCIENLS